MKRCRPLLSSGLVVVLAALLVVSPVAADPGGGAIQERFHYSYVLEYEFFGEHVYIADDYRTFLVSTTHAQNYSVHWNNTFMLTDVATGETTFSGTFRELYHVTSRGGELQQTTLITQARSSSGREYTVRRAVYVLSNGEVRVDHIWINGEKIL